MSSLVEDIYTIPPKGWNLKWENPDKIKEKEEMKKKKDLEEFNIWKDKYMKDFNEEELKKKKLYFIGQKESTHLANLSYRIKT